MTPIGFALAVDRDGGSRARHAGNLIERRRWRRATTTLRSVEEWRPSELLGPVELHRRFVEALDAAVRCAPTPDRFRRKPLDLQCCDPLPPHLRVYLFNCTDHPAERDPGGYRIQLHVPGQQKRQRGNFAHATGVLLLVVGFVAEFDVFVLWDVHAHPNFPNSKGVQVASGTVHGAAIHGLAEQQRELRSAGYREQVIAARADRLVEGVHRRQELTHESLLGAEQPALAFPSDEAI
jgi:restriction-modification system family protein